MSEAEGKKRIKVQIFKALEYYTVEVESDDEEEAKMVAIDFVKEGKIKPTLVAGPIYFAAIFEGKKPQVGGPIVVH